MLNKKFIFPIMYLFAYLFTFYIVIQYGFFKPEQSAVVSSKLINPSFPYEVWKLFFYPHIVLGVLALLIGAFQFTNRSRRQSNLHKILGRIYGGVIFANVLIVPFIALYATGGRGSTIAFLVLDVLWFGTTAMGVRSILKKNIGRHREWMLRSYAITFVFVTFRIILIPVQMILELPLDVAFPVSVYISIAINLLLTELYLRKPSSRTAKILKRVV